MSERTKQRAPDSETTIAELLELWPACANVLNERRMACTGCELSTFETIAGAARVYDVDESQLLVALRAAAGLPADNR